MGIEEKDYKIAKSYGYEWQSHSKVAEMKLSDLTINQTVTYEGYTFRVTGFRQPGTVYLKPVGIAKKVYRGEIAVKVAELE